MKYIIDPVHGFTPIEDGLVAFLVRHPLFQRLTRIRQLGVEGLVYPGAQHTRFQHSLGAYHLTRLAVARLRESGTDISPEERDAILSAILLHDAGHGPFSHVLEHVIVPSVSHEHISRLVMERINAETGGALTTAIAVFTDTYDRHFLHELVSSQLDMDRLDYLCRDSFFTGVREGNVGASRIIQMLGVKDDHIVVLEKGLYSVENYLMSRRMMYWQVYFHKTAVGAEFVLTGALKRARELMQAGHRLFCSPALAFFLSRTMSRDEFDSDAHALNLYLDLDDNDILSSLKVWQHSDDMILARLSSDFINRRLFKVRIYDGVISPDILAGKTSEMAAALNISPVEAGYFAGEQVVEKDMYSMQADQIRILSRSGEVRTMPDVSEIIRSDSGAPAYRKTYLMYERL